MLCEVLEVEVHKRQTLIYQKLVCQFISVKQQCFIFFFQKNVQKLVGYTTQNLLLNSFFTFWYAWPVRDRSWGRPSAVLLEPLLTDFAFGVQPVCTSQPDIGVFRRSAHPDTAQVGEVLVNASVLSKLFLFKEY